jgi:hypothetical protein
VQAGTPAAEGVSEADMKKREKGWAEKKRKLKDPKYAIRARHARTIQYKALQCLGAIWLA